MNLGGGVGTWVREDLDYEMMQSPFIEKTIETQTILLTDKNLIIINVYRPFGDLELFFEHIFAHLARLKIEEPNCEVVMTGDFNIDLLKTTKASQKLLEDTVLHSFIQRVTIPSRETDGTKSIIDHVYTKSKTNPYTDVLISDISDHYILVTTFPSISNKKVKIMITKRWFKADDYKSMPQLIGGQDMTSISGMNAEDASAHLINCIENAEKVRMIATNKSIKPTRRY